jgi:2'-5' RNA ligase
MTLRSFIAVDIGPLDELVKFEEEISESGANVKLVEPENIHITLKFLGDTSEELVPKINEIIAESVSDIKPFEIKFNNAGAFPNLNYIKVLWVGIDDIGPLPEIAKRLDSNLKNLGFKSDSRGFKPHITVGRVKTKRNKNLLKRLVINSKDRIFGKLLVNKICLKKSILDSRGPTYYTIGEVNL